MCVCDCKIHWTKRPDRWRMESDILFLSFYVNKSQSTS